MNKKHESLLWTNRCLLCLWCKTRNKSSKDANVFILAIYKTIEELLISNVIANTKFSKVNMDDNIIISKN